MERALSLEGLRLALGEGQNLPTPEQLQDRLSEAEIALFLGRGEVDQELLRTAWYLLAVGTARPSLNLYPVDRQRRANQVSAHIFDLALASAGLSQTAQMEMTFAAQVGYLRGDLDPNAIALYRRTARGGPDLLSSPGLVSLDVASSLLAMDRPRVRGNAV